TKLEQQNRHICMFIDNFSDLDEAGEQDIYKLNILEGMTTAKQAWYAITPETMEHCWDHTKIQLDSTASADPQPHTDPVVWKTLQKFATMEMSLPNAESDLQAHLGNCFVDSDWRPALKAVMDAEGDMDIALNALNTLAQAASHHTTLKIWIPAHPQKADQLSSAEAELMQSVNNLKAHNRIFGTLPTINELLDPAKEREMGELPAFKGGDKSI
ncbi:uncharacterized protein EDB91DRAFT_1025664, partial [Suillus paluster]|uniref:uncharacterized protein n=1 Tax=Suillus paluster TaxID=48578 RepID=UPI001B86FD03